MSFYAGTASVDGGNNTGWLFRFPPGGLWYAGTASVDGGNNTGWIFTAPPEKNAVSRGGFKAKKQPSKVYKDARKEVEDDVAKAIAKVTGENKAEVTVEKVNLEVNNLEVKIRVAEEAQTQKLQEIAMKAQALALQAEIDRLIQAELDDEESLMLLL